MKINQFPEKLDVYFRQVQEIILNRQDWVSGLLPASTAINSHGNYTDAWVRDNVYSIMAAWGLALAYRRTGENEGRTFLLQQSVVKLMRGLLTAMMRQASKVEKFKQSQNPGDALHAKYDTKSGVAVVADHEWGHLQLDATSLFLLMLAQMTASGLRIVFTIDEVNFVQNLVHYISRTYRTPDYGIWERGNKTNHGVAELNGSSIGMAKAALEAMSGFNLFGTDGGQASVIHVISDDIARTRIALEALLPRESISKETDSALLSITGFPAFAVDNVEIRARTNAIIKNKLEGRYGCKRFLLDGHQTAIEDSHRSYYEPHELKQFMDIECEWPLFFCYLLLNHLFAGDYEQAAEYREKLQKLLVEQDGQWLVPELYIVPEQAINAEKAQPQSQQRVANENIPLVWAQSLFILAGLIQDDLLSCEDIDPLGRHKAQSRQASLLQIALLAEDEAVQAQLSEYGISTQTLSEVAPIQIRDASELAEAYAHVGRNDRIGLTGRPLRQLRTLSTAKLYVLSGEPLVFLPQFLNQKGFYLAMDNRLLIKRFVLELSYIYKHWEMQGNPLMVIPIKHNMLGGQNRQVLIEFINELKTGKCKNVPVKLGLLSDFVVDAGFEKINYLHDFSFSAATWENVERPFYPVLPFDLAVTLTLAVDLLTEWETSDESSLLSQLASERNLYAHLEILGLLANRHGLDYDTGLKTESGLACRLADLLEELYAKAGDFHLWTIVRRCAGLLGKYDINLEQSATEILVRQHHLTVGRAYSGKATLTQPADSSVILQKIRHYNSQDGNEQIIIQELIIYLGMLIKSNPELFTDMHTIRVGHILQLLITRQSRLTGCLIDQAFNAILHLPPHQLFLQVQETLQDFSNTESQLELVESLHSTGAYSDLSNLRFTDSMNPKDRADSETWLEWRERHGSVGRDSDAFFGCVWDILHHCQGVTIGDKFNSKRRLESSVILSQMTRGEQSFKLHVSHLLNKIQSAAYRQLTVEAIRTVASIVRDHALQIDDTLVTDVLIGHAVKLHWMRANATEQLDYDGLVTEAWQNFYQLPPNEVANGILDALLYLLAPVEVEAVED